MGWTLPKKRSFNTSLWNKRYPPSHNGLLTIPMHPKHLKFKSTWRGFNRFCVKFLLKECISRIIHFFSGKRLIIFSGLQQIKMHFISHDNHQDLTLWECNELLKGYKQRHLNQSIYCLGMLFLTIRFDENSKIQCECERICKYSFSN